MAAHGLPDIRPAAAPAGRDPDRREREEHSPADAERLFRALTLRRVSRNKYFSSFTTAFYRRVHRRYRVVRSVEADAERLAGMPGSSCHVRREGRAMRVCLESPRLQYRREVSLLPYEWKWLAQQPAIRLLVAAAARRGADAHDRLPP